MAIEDFKVDPKKATKEQLERALELLAREEERKDKIKRGVIKGSRQVKYADLTPEQKAARNKANLNSGPVSGIAVRWIDDAIA